MDGCAYAFACVCGRVRSARVCVFACTGGHTDAYKAFVVLRALALEGRAGRVLAVVGGDRRASPQSPHVGVHLPFACRLVSDDILRLVGPHSRMVYVGKHNGFHTRSQVGFGEVGGGSCMAKLPSCCAAANHLSEWGHGRACLSVREGEDTCDTELLLPCPAAWPHPTSPHATTTCRRRSTSCC